MKINGLQQLYENYSQDCSKLKGYSPLRLSCDLLNTVFIISAFLFNKRAVVRQ